MYACLCLELPKSTLNDNAFKKRETRVPLTTQRQISCTLAVSKELRDDRILSQFSFVKIVHVGEPGKMRDRQKALGNKIYFKTKSEKTPKS